MTEPEVAGAEPVQVTPADGETFADLPVLEPAAESDEKRAAEPDETPVGGLSEGSAAEPGEGPARATAAEPELTGHDAVDNSLCELTDAANLPPGEQIEAYEAAHRTLQETLRGIEEV